MFEVDKEDPDADRERGETKETDRDSHLDTNSPFLSSQKLSQTSNSNPLSLISTQSNHLNYINLSSNNTSTGTKPIYSANSARVTLIALVIIISSICINIFFFCKLHVLQDQINTLEQENNPNSPIIPSLTGLEWRDTGTTGTIIQITDLHWNPFYQDNISCASGCTDVYIDYGTYNQSWATCNGNNPLYSFL